MLWKCCTQYTSKLSSSLRTGKGQFSFQSQRKAMPKNVQTTVQLHSFHMLVSVCSKSFELGFSSTWTKNFQMYLTQAVFWRDRGTRDQIANIHWIMEQIREFQKNIYFSSLTMLKPLIVWVTTNCENILRDGTTRPPYLSPEKPIAGQETTVRMNLE